jgi:hypothetical protein
LTEIKRGMLFSFQATTTHHPNAHLFRFPPPLERLQRIPFPPTDLEATGSIKLALELLTPDLLILVHQRNETNLLRCDCLLAFLGEEVVGYVLEMRLCPRRSQLSVVAQVLEFCRVLFEMAFQLLGLEEFLPNLACSCLADGDFCDGAGILVSNCWE